MRRSLLSCIVWFMNILYEDNEILVCVKPEGIATQSADVRAKDMVSMVNEHVKGYVGLVHRLDQPVSGLLVFAKTPAAAASLSKQVQGSGMGKCYRAVVEGRVDETDAPVILTNCLIRDAKAGKAVVVPPGRKDAAGKPAKEARLTYELLSYDEAADSSTLFIRLQTGRFHQIRAQLAHIGHPVLRDVKYGAKKPADPNGPAGIALCACELSFLHPATGESMHFTLS